MRRFRTILFWTHLVAGVAAGLIIFTMAATGALLALERPVLSWLDGRAPPPSPGAPRLPVDELVARARAARSGAAASAVTVSAAPGAPALVSFGREDVLAVDPTTGAVQPQGARGARRFFRSVQDLHRHLALPGDAHEAGEAATGAANLAFLFLALSGLYLWLPRTWKRGGPGPAWWFRRGLHGKARHWNWHNVIGFWCAPVLVVLTVSGAVISYRWASDLVYRVAGTQPPAGGRAPAPRVTPPSEGATPLPLAALFDEAARQAPAWESVTARLESPRGGGVGGGGERPAGPAAISLTVRERDPSPAFATAQLWMDPFTGTVLRKDGYATADAGRRARSWLRFLHTGEALGWAGQCVAAVASLGGAFLAYTGLALALRRYLGRRRSSAAAGVKDEQAPVPTPETAPPAA